jgi:F-type H+-transporting ATPase subunit delta
MQIARKYAQALFNEASKLEILSKVGDEIVALSEAIFLRPEVAKTLSSPVARNKSEILLEKVAQKYKVTSLTTNFLKTLVKLKRLQVMPSIVQEYQKLMDAAEGNKLVDVIYSSKPNDAEQRGVEKILNSRFGKAMVVKYTVDNTILGGVVIKYDSVVIDASVKGAIDRML